MKKIILILALILMIVLPVYGQTGTTTTYGYFYLPAYGAYGLTEWTEYNTYMQIADTQIESNKIEASKNKWNGTQAPTVNNDVDEGYLVGSKWYDVTNDNAYTCLDNTDGAAVWSKFAPSGGTGWVDISGAPEDDDIAVWIDADTVEGKTLAELNLTIGTDIEAHDTTLTDIADGTINENLVNTANPWADDEVADNITASNYYLKTEIDTLSEVETIYSANITDSTELATALTDYYLKTAIDTLGEVETIYSADIVDTTEMATALTDYYLKTAIDTQGEMETIWGVSLANDSELHTILTLGTASGLSLSTQELNLAVADTNTTGALNDTDWDTFNDKIANITGEDLFDLSDVAADPNADRFLMWDDNPGTNVWHQLIETDISDLGSYITATLTQEEVDDYVNALIEDTDSVHTRITITYDDTDNAFDFVVDDLDTNLTEEEVEDFVGGMFGGTETLISVDYQDETNDIDFVVTIPEDHINATMLKDDNAPADEDLFCYELTGTTGHWYSRAEVGIGVATSITDDLIVKADFADEDWGDMTVATNIITLDAEVVDSAQYVDASVDHEHLAPDVISGLADVTSADADYMMIWDVTDSALKKVDMGEVRGAGGGYTNLTSFVNQTAWRLFYSNTDGDVVELALGTDNTYLRSHGATSAPSFTSPSSGSGDKTNWVIPQDYATGAGTEGDPWAGSCIEDAYTACPTGGTIYLRAGYYELANANFVIAKSINIIGEGIGKTFIITTLTSGSAIYMDGQSHITLKGFTIDGDSISGSGSNINIHDSSYIIVEDVETKNAGTEGINPYEVNHSLFQNIYAHDNNNHGIHPGSDHAGTNMYNTYRDIYCWNNTLYGFYDRGVLGSLPFDTREECHNVFDHIYAWDNTQTGIAIQGQKTATISNCFATGNGTYGFSFGQLENSNISNCVATRNGITNSVAGILFGNSKDINVTNVIALNNYNGIQTTTCSDIKFNSCQSYDNRKVTGTDIAFVDGGGGADTITQTAAQFLSAEFEAGETITISGSASNDGDETIVSVVAGTITLATGTLVAEGAGASVTITQYKQRYGIEISGVNTNISINDCKVSPNWLGTIRNLSSSTYILASGVADTTVPVAGDIQYHNGTNWIRLAKGTAGQVLTMNAGATAPEWQTP